jgi:epoxyqueuosine reductase
VSQTFTEQIKEVVLGWGADLVGIADVEAMKSLRTSPADLLRPFSSAVSIALQMPVAVFESITDRPTPEYSAVYQTANRLLDEIAFKISRMLQKNGEYSLPIPASQVLDRKNWVGAISHKAVARMAGLGWQGKNLLLITPQFGSRVRLVTVLSSAALDADHPVKNRCGACHACKDACPVQAIKGINTIDHYRDRDEALFFSRCAEKLSREFAEIPGVGAPICGICIKVCPFGRRPRHKRVKGETQ